MSQTRIRTLQSSPWFPFQTIQNKHPPKVNIEPQKFYVEKNRVHFKEKNTCGFLGVPTPKRQAIGTASVSPHRPRAAAAAAAPAVVEAPEAAVRVKVPGGGPSISVLSRKPSNRKPCKPCPSRWMVSISGNSRGSFFSGNHPKQRGKRPVLGKKDACQEGGINPWRNVFSRFV